MTINEDTLAMPPRQGREVTLNTCACVLERIADLEDELMREQTDGWKGTK